MSISIGLMAVLFKYVMRTMRKNYKNYLPYLFYLLISLTGYNCSKKNECDLQNQRMNSKIQEVVASANAVCGAANPEQSLLWLKEIISKAQEDKNTMKHQGNYKGKIFSTSYHNQSVFYITMMMRSGGLYAYIFDCTGKTVTIEQNDVSDFSQNAEKGMLIYSNVPM